MRPLHRSILSGATALSTLLLSGIPVFATTIELQTNPPLSDVVPFSKPVALSLSAFDDRGVPIKDAVFEIKLLTPPKTPWFTSDFPIVEGTTLLDLTLEADQGTATFDTTMPIRGPYQLQVKVVAKDSDRFEPYSKNLTLQVPENPEKYWNAAILVGILLLVGLVGGWIIGGEQEVRPGEMAPRRVQWLLSGAAITAIITMLFIGIMAEQADAHGDGEHDEAVLKELLQKNPVPQEITAELADRAPAVVGQLVPFSVTAAMTDGTPINNAVLDVEVRSVEYDRPVMSLTGQSNSQGEFAWQQQFFDGAPHQVIVKVSPEPNSDVQFTPFVLAETIDVEGIAPPMPTRLISLAYFTAFLAVGTGLGYWLKQSLKAQSA